MPKLRINRNTAPAKRVFAICSTVAGTRDEQFSDCLNQAGILLSESNSKLVPLKLTIFVNAENHEDFLKIKKLYSYILKSIFGDIAPLTLFVAQPPASGSEVAMEVLACDMENTFLSISYNQLKNSSFISIENGSDKFVCGSGIECYDENLKADGHSDYCFESIKEILSASGLGFSNIVRQWSYIGEITNPARSANGTTENYQFFNISRAKYYQDSYWEKGYPSATGIGTNIPGCSVEFIAESFSTNKQIIALHNPNQQNAHGYSERYIKPLKENEGISTPKFERGKIVIGKSVMDVYISGTAAILGEDSIQGDIVRQTEITIKNILELISSKNLHDHGIQIDGELPPFSIVRVYLKDKKDFETVQSICIKYFGIVPMIFVQADVCREELLVEIEAYLSCGIEIL